MKIRALFASKMRPNDIVLVDSETNVYSGTLYDNYVVVRMWIHDGSLSPREQRIDFTESSFQRPSRDRVTFLK